MGENSQAVGKKSHGLGFRWDNVAAAVFLKMLLQLFFLNVVVADLIVVSVDEVGGLQCCILPDF